MATGRIKKQLQAWLMNIFVFTLASRILLLKPPEPFYTPHTITWQHRIWKHLGQSSSKVFFIYVHTASFQQNVPILIGNELPTFFQNTFLLCSTNGSRHAQDTIINEADAMSLTATQDLLPHAPGARRMVLTPHIFRTNAHYKDTTPC